MDLFALIRITEDQYHRPIMAFGGGKVDTSGQVAAAEAQRKKAQAEAEAVRAQQAKEKEKAAADQLAANVAQANADSARRSKNRMLLAGAMSEEGGTSEDGMTSAEKRAKRNSLYGA